VKISQLLLILPLHHVLLFLTRLVEHLLIHMSFRILELVLLILATLCALRSSDVSLPELVCSTIRVGAMHSCDSCYLCCAVSVAYCKHLSWISSCRLSHSHLM
jgi:hypothetical protein